MKWPWTKKQRIDYSWQALQEARHSNEAVYAAVEVLRTELTKKIQSAYEDADKDNVVWMQRVEERFDRIEAVLDPDTASGRERIERIDARFKKVRESAVAKHPLTIAAKKAQASGMDADEFAVIVGAAVDAAIEKAKKSRRRK